MSLTIKWTETDLVDGVLAGKIDDPAISGKLQVLDEVPAGSTAHKYTFRTSPEGRNFIQFGTHFPERMLNFLNGSGYLPQNLIDKIREIPIEKLTKLPEEEGKNGG